MIELYHKRDVLSFLILGNGYCMAAFKVGTRATDFEAFRN